MKLCALAVLELWLHEVEGSGVIIARFERSPPSSTRNARTAQLSGGTGTSDP